MEKRKEKEGIQRVQSNEKWFGGHVSPTYNGSTHKMPYMHEKWNFSSSWGHIAKCFILLDVYHVIKNKLQKVTLAIF